MVSKSNNFYYLQYMTIYSSYLKPMLQDAIQKKDLTRAVSDGQIVKGPLTWSDFVRSGNKNAGFSDIEPMPVPQLQLSSGDNDVVRMGPSSLQFMDKLGLEPAGKKRDVFYLAILPDSSCMQSKAKR